MEGTHLRLYTYENRKGHGRLVHEWLLEQARGHGQVVPHSEHNRHYANINDPDVHGPIFASWRSAWLIPVACGPHGRIELAEIRIGPFQSDAILRGPALLLGDAAQIISCLGSRSATRGVRPRDSRRPRRAYRCWFAQGRTRDAVWHGRVMDDTEFAMSMRTCRRVIPHHLRR